MFTTQSQAHFESRAARPGIFFFDPFVWTYCKAVALLTGIYAALSISLIF